MGEWQKHKNTMVCPQKGCTYSSKMWMTKTFNKPKEKWKVCNESSHCPIHRVELVYHRSVENHPLNDNNGKVKPKEYEKSKK